jgi:hypothetical protein
MSNLAPDEEADMGGGHSPATDPRGVALAGEQPDNWHPTGAPRPRNTSDLTSEERDYHRRVFGVTYRERYGSQAGRCVTYCLTPGQRRRGTRCPCCYQAVEIRPMDGSDVEPGPTRAERFAAWAGGWIFEFWYGLTFPWRLDQARLRDLMTELLEAGMAVDLVQVCPVCEAAESREEA